MDISDGSNIRAVLDRRGDEFSDRMRGQFEIRLVRFQPGHFRCLAHQVINSVALLVNDRQKLFPLLAVEFQIVKQTRRRHFDGRKRSPEVVCDGIQQHRFQALTFAGRFDPGDILDGGGPFDGQADDSSHRLKRLAGGCRAAKRDASRDRFSQSNGSERNVTTSGHLQMTERRYRLQVLNLSRAANRSPNKMSSAWRKNRALRIQARTMPQYAWESRQLRQPSLSHPTACCSGCRVSPPRGASGQLPWRGFARSC